MNFEFIKHKKSDSLPIKLPKSHVKRKGVRDQVVQLESKIQKQSLILEQQNAEIEGISTMIYFFLLSTLDTIYYLLFFTMGSGFFPYHGEKNKEKSQVNIQCFFKKKNSWQQIYSLGVLFIFCTVFEILF